MKKIFSKVVILISGLTMSGLSLAQSYVSSQQVFRNAQGQIYQPANVPVTVYNSNTVSTLTPVYPEVVSTYNVTTPVYQQQQPIYTSGVVEDVLPWLLVGGAVAAIASYDNHDRYHGYHRPPPPRYKPQYRPAPPRYKPHVNHYSPKYRPAPQRHKNPPSHHRR